MTFDSVGLSVARESLTAAIVDPFVFVEDLQRYLERKLVGPRLPAADDLGRRDALGLEPACAMPSLHYH